MPASKQRRRAGDLAVVEAIYELSLPLNDWLYSLSRAITRDLNSSLGSLTIRGERQPDGSYDVTPLYVDTPPEIRESFSAVIGPVAAPNSEMLAGLIRRPLSGLIETFPAGDPYRQMCARYLRPIGGVDTIAFAAFDTPAHLVTVSPLFAREATPTEAVRAKYIRLSAHLASAMRLRRRLDANIKEEPDAIFDPGARACHAQGEARSTDALQQLKAAVRARETARARMGTNGAGEGLQLWKAMVSGRWSLLDRFESDGRRFVIALANQNIPKDPRALTPREQQVAQLAGFGAPNGRIAYALGISAQCVSAHLHAALRKLRCASRRDLIRMMSRSNTEFTLDVHGEVIGVIAEPAGAQSSPQSLTPAERRVFAAIQRGKSNAEIAAELGTSVRTVANQVASILRKTKAASRYALMSAQSPGVV